VHGSVDATATREVAVGGSDDCLCLRVCDVACHDLDLHASIVLTVSTGVQQLTTDQVIEIVTSYRW
jgi:hypothetical protein